MPVITLTTDFGLQDGFIGTLKGVIWSICPAAQVADISQDIPAQDVLAGARTLWRACTYFPVGTVHLAVVDPGVGTRRRALAMHLGEWFFVGPDNGLFTLILDEAGKNGWKTAIFQLTEPKYWLKNVSQTFHGRDIFAPVAAHIANGVPLSDLGPAIHDPVRLRIPQPEQTAQGWRAHIVGIDAFGNLATDLSADMLRKHSRVRVRVGRFEVRGVAHTYGEGSPGDLIILIDSAGQLEIAVVNGSAAQITRAQVGDMVEFEYPEQ